MKKNGKFLLGLVLLISGYSINAQVWDTSNSSLFVNPTNTRIGIGTTSPLAKLHVNALNSEDPLRMQINGSTRFWLNSNGGLSVGSYTLPPPKGLFVYGNVGIGTATPGSPLDVNGKITSSQLKIDYHTNVDWTYAVYIKVNREKTKALSIIDDSGLEVFSIYGNGVLNSKKIYSESFQVRPDAMGIYWYDHVFNEDYKLMPLRELESYVQNNKHLPDIPSQIEVDSCGFDLVEMQGLLLEKIEELTLYMLQQQDEIDNLKAIIDEKEGD